MIPLVLSQGFVRFDEPVTAADVRKAGLPFIEAMNRYMKAQGDSRGPERVSRSGDGVPEDTDPQR